VQDCKLQLYREHDKPDKLHLSLNGQNIFDWFKQKYQEIKKVTNTLKPSLPTQNRGRGL
jgi:hypothetical protein